MSTKITNEMLYELLKEFKNDSKQKFEQVHLEIYDLKQDRREDRQILMKIFESRNEVVAKVTWDFIWKA